jgi:hypothetical protein
MPQLNTLLTHGCFEGQGFGKNYNPLYRDGGDLGHPGVDVECGYASPINPLARGFVYSMYTPDHPANDGYTAVFTVCETPLEVFEMSYGHVSEIDCKTGDYVTPQDIIAKEGNHGPVYSGNTQITLAMQAAGDHRGHHRHYQKRPLIKTSQLRGVGLQTANGTYRDAMGNYYQVYAPYNGFRGCIDWTAPMFPRDLGFLAVGYDVYLLQKAMVREGFATYAPTGNFGALTFASVRAYQKAHSLPATGYCGPRTRALLNASYSQLS